MPDSRYHFVTHWRVAGSPQEVMDILEEAAGLPRWWPAVYRKVQVLAPGDENGVGTVIDLTTKGFLPYTLRWQFQVVEKIPSRRLRIQAWGDFNGTGLWTFEPEGPFTRITYDWDIRVEKPLLRQWTYVLRPLFAANHRWAMRKGGQSLRLELARRHVRSPEAAALIPAPPPPTTSSPLPLVFMALGFIGLLAWLVQRRQHA